MKRYIFLLLMDAMHILSLKVLSENGLIDDEHEPEIPRSKSSKRRRIEDDLEPETPKKRKVDEEFKTPKKKRNSSVKKCSLTRKVMIVTCASCCKIFHKSSQHKIYL